MNTLRNLTGEPTRRLTARDGAVPARIAILILNYNGSRDTIECLESILQDWHHTYDLIVIDNASTDDSVDRIRVWAQNRIPPVDLGFGIAPEIGVERESGGSNSPRI